MSLTDPMRASDTVKYWCYSTVSRKSAARHKVIVIDEDGNTTNDVQLLLKSVYGGFSGNCRFIFTCNFKNKIIEPLHSRCAHRLLYRQKVQTSTRSTFFNRLRFILEREGVEADPKVLIELINKHFPDWRRVLNECQRYSSSGIIDAGILAQFSDVKVNDLIKHLKEKDFKEVRKWVVNNLDNDASVLLRRVYDAMDPWFNSIPAAFLLSTVPDSICGRSRD